MSNPSLLSRLSHAVGEAFAAEGLDPALGRVQPSDRPDLAPFQCNGALAAAKQAKKNPRELAQAVATRLEADDLFAEVTLAGPGFLNLTVTDAVLAETANAIAADPDKGAWKRETAEKIVLDYGGPNVAKPLHVGHLRSAIIGEALKRLFKAVGDDVMGDIHLGDWGLQMGQLITQLEIEQPDLPYFVPGATGPFPPESPVTVDNLARIYPVAAQASKEDPARREAARKATAALQSGHPGYTALWRHFVDVSKAALEKDYAELGVTFDLWKGEADVHHRIAPLVDRLREGGFLEESDGAQVIRVAREDDKKDIPPLIMLSSEGSALYATTDMATIDERVDELGAERIVYVVDQRQAQHFEQVFRAADKVGLISEGRLEFAGFGTMNGTDGRPFKTREGGVLRLRDLIDQVVEEAGDRLRQGSMGEDLPEAERQSIAKDVGIAALKFADLSNPRQTDYIFDPKKFVTFEGKTGPYLLYAVVRIRSVLAKAGAEHLSGEIVASHEAERELILALAAFPEAMRSAYEKRLPHILCEHAFSLAQAFSRFYAACRIGDEADEKLRFSRLVLAKTTHDQLLFVLTLLGLPVPARM